MQLLDTRQIEQKTRRLAIEIWENNWGTDHITLIGINNNGMHFANLLIQQMSLVANKVTALANIRLNPADPLGFPIEIDKSLSDLEDETIILVDDVANTGRTLFYACKPLLEIKPRKLEVAVLVDRTHKSFPIRVDYVGMSLATTLKQNINVRLKDTDQPIVFLE